MLLESGLGEYKNILLWWIPLSITVLFYLVVTVFGTHLAKMINNLLAILPSLTGFLIASATILISINTPRMSSKKNGLIFTYAEIGGAIFFKCIKLSILLLIFSFLAPDVLPDWGCLTKYILVTFSKAIMLLLFSKLVVMMIYGLLFLSSAIESTSEKET